MLCLPLAVILLAQVTHPIRTAYVTSSPSLVARLDRMYEKLEKLTVAPAIISPSPIPYLSDEEEELLTAMQIWGDLTPDQLNGVAKDLQRIRADADEDRTERLSDLEYADLEDNEEDYTDIDYHNNGKEDEDEEDNDKYADQPVISVGPITASKKVSKTDYDSFIKVDTQASTLDPKILNVTPLAFTKNKSKYETIISAVDSIAATNERPRILEELSLTPVDRQMLRKAALANIAQVIQAGKCLVPQPRWLSVRQLLPAANIRFIPPCVQLHRCASDSGCCLNEGMVCAPVDGQYVAIPFYLHKANENVIEARMMFYNHTTCACVDRKTLQATTTTQRNMITHSVMTDSVASSEQRQNDWRPPSPTQAHTVETTEADDATAPPQLKRCTCPTYFLANITDSGTCSCACDWRDAVHRRECLLFSRGKEHLGLRDRVCIAAGNCAPPVCDFGAYDMTVGKCPIKKLGVKRIRFSYHVRRHQQDKNVV